MKEDGLLVVERERERERLWRSGVCKGLCLYSLLFSCAVKKSVFLECTLDGWR
jgi:hypothetical protein